MFDKPFEQLFRALERIENQLAAADHEQKKLLREELMALRSISDRFVEKWLAFEEKIADLTDFFDLENDPMQPPLPSVPSGKPAAKLQEVPFTGTYTSPFADKQDEAIFRSFRKGLGYFDLLMYPDAIRELERAVALDGDFAMARLYLALGYFGKGEFDKSAQQLNLVAVGQKDPLILSVVHNTFGQIYAARSEYGRAAQEFKQAASYSPDFTDAYFNLGVCQYHLHQAEDALVSFRKVLESDGQDWEAEQIVSLAWQQLGAVDKAHRHIEQAYRLNSSHYGVLIQFADLSQQVGKLDLARSLYNRARRFYPNRSEPLGGMGWIELRKGNVKEATVLFKKQLSLAPQHPQANFNYGWLLMMQGEVAAAERIFQTLAEKHPNFDLSRIGLARAYQFQDQPHKAQQILNQMLLSPERSIRKIGYLQLGKWAVEQGDYQHAIEQLQQALQLDRFSREAWYYKGLAHSGLGQTEEAKKCWNLCKV
jgi:tetratricopeptide (TPR) repeat protein